MSSSQQDRDAIHVENVSKLYRLEAQQGSLRDAVAQALAGWSRGGRRQSPQVLWALKDVSFVLRRGEALGIVGPNGAGKTTLLKVLSRVTRPTSGIVDVRGRLAALIELGAGFHPDLTGRENIYLNGSIRGLSRKEIHQRLESIVSFAGLEKFIDMPVKRYSSGMYVRLGFAVAAHTEPEVLLVDEILAVGDAEFRQKCIERIRAMREEGVSIIFISHNLFQVQAVCDRGIFMLGGQVYTEGTIAEAVGAYEAWLRETRKVDTVSTFDFHRGQGGGDLNILGAELCDAEGRAATCISYDQGVVLQTQFLARRPFDALHFEVRIIRSDGLICARIRSVDLALDTVNLDGKGSLSIYFPQLRLTTGRYTMEIRLADQTGAVTLAHCRSPIFQVSAPDTGTGLKGGVFLPHISGVDLTYDPPLASKQPTPRENLASKV